MSPFFSGLLQALAGSAMAILAFVVIRVTGVGERLLDHRLNKKLAEMGHESATAIEQLRADLAHFQDRGRRANELEFEALTKVWRSYVDAWIKTQRAIVDAIEHPDLNMLSSEELTTFLESTDFSNVQRNQVAEAENKNDAYVKIIRLRTIHSAGAAIYDGRQTLRAEGIYLSAPITSRFWNAFENLSGAQVERFISFQHGRRVGSDEKSLAVLDTRGTGEIAEVQELVRSTIRRD